jgi:hypothetical protein
LLPKFKKLLVSYGAIGSSTQPARIQLLSFAKIGLRFPNGPFRELMPKKDGKPAQAWMTFLRNHVGEGTASAEQIAQ